jgi:hypothetical protein
MPKHEFDSIFSRLQSSGIPYGDRFNTVGAMTGPSDERGAQGIGKSIYFFDPDRHLLEIRYYPSAHQPIKTGKDGFQSKR